MDGKKSGGGRGKAPVPLDEAEAERLRQTRLKLIGLSFQFGFTIVGAFILFMGGGIALDRWLGTSPIFLLIGMVVAFMAIGYSLYEIATIGYKPRAKSVAGETPQPTATPVAQRGYDDDPEPQDDWDRDDWKRDDWKRDDDWPVRRAGDKGGRS